MDLFSWMQAGTQKQEDTVTVKGIVGAMTSPRLAQTPGKRPGLKTTQMLIFTEKNKCATVD